MDIIQRFNPLLNESMTLSVIGADYDRHDNLMDLSFHFQRAAYFVLEKLPEDQIEYFRRNRPRELLVPDGQSDIHSNVGILNLYFSGYTFATLKLILQAIKSKAKELNVVIGKMKVEDSGMFKYKVIRIPIIKNDNSYKGAPDVNMSNVNAYHIFHNILQFDSEDETQSSFLFSAEELKNRIETILKHDPDWVDKNNIPSFDSSIPSAEQDSPQDMENPHLDFVKKFAGNARLISGGLNSHQIRDRLKSILEVALWAIKHGKSKLYVG